MKHGKWIPKRVNEMDYFYGGSWYTYYFCSECGYNNEFKQSNYCPRCGSKMQKEEG